MAMKREGEENPLGETHEAAVNLLYVLIVLHLGGVIFETRRSGRGLVLAMLPGRR
jgi:cytochrome b